MQVNGRRLDQSGRDHGKQCNTGPIWKELAFLSHKDCCQVKYRPRISRSQTSAYSSFPLCKRFFFFFKTLRSKLNNLWSVSPSLHFVASALMYSRTLIPHGDILSKQDFEEWLAQKSNRVTASIGVCPAEETCPLIPGHFWSQHRGNSSIKPTLHSLTGGI
jgi:hypothetical protein